jgi:hypothetical protein
MAKKYSDLRVLKNTRLQPRFPSQMKTLAFLVVVIVSLLVPLQSPLIHHSCLSQLALSFVENAKAVNCIECGYMMVCTEYLLISL